MLICGPKNRPESLSTYRLFAHTLFQIHEEFLTCAICHYTVAFGAEADTDANNSSSSDNDDDDDDYYYFFLLL